MMPLPMLTANSRKLILQLASLPYGWLTAATLAQAIGVSRRTVLRELTTAEDWLQAAGYTLRRSPGQGILLDEPEERREQLRRLAAQGSETDVLPRTERRQQLLLTLLKAEAPLSAPALAEELLVSEHTLAADLVWAGVWLGGYGLTLCKKTGLSVQGSPVGRRRAIGALLRLLLPQQALQDTLEHPDHTAFFGLLDPETAAQVWKLLLAFEQAEGLNLTDAAFLSLAVHCILTVQQLRAGAWEAAPAESSRDRRLAGRLALELEETFQLHLSQREVAYLAQYLEAYGAAPAQDWGTAEELELRELASILAEQVGETLEVDLSRYPTLTQDLFRHLRPMLYRIRQGTPVENPQLELLQGQYAPLWQATRKACDTAQRLLELPHIPDAEAGFLVMHFGAVMEQEKRIRSRVRALVVCPYGMASGRFLASQLQQEFPAMDISACDSARGLDPHALRRQGVELVVSTVPLTLDFPNVCVNAILQPQDRALLEDAIDKARQAAALQPLPVSQPDLRQASALSRALLELPDTLKIETVSLPRTREGLISAAAKLFCPRTAEAKAVERVLLRRETLGDTYIKPLGALLLHGKTNAVPGCRVGYLSANPPVYEQGRMIRGAVVLLAPEDADRTAIQAMQAVSALLIEEPEFPRALQAGDRETAVRLLEQGLARQFEQALRT